MCERIPYDPPAGWREADKAAWDAATERDVVPADIRFFGRNDAGIPRYCESRLRARQTGAAVVIVVNDCNCALPTRYFVPEERP